MRSVYRLIMAVFPLFFYVPCARAGEQPFFVNDDYEDYRLHAIASFGGQPGACLLVADHVFIGEHDRLRVLNASNRSEPREIGSLQMDQRIFGILKYQHYLYVLTHRYWSGYGYLQIVDIADPAKPKLVNKIDADEFDDHKWWSVSIWRDYLFSHGQAYRLRDPLNPGADCLAPPDKRDLFERIEREDPDAFNEKSEDEFQLPEWLKPARLLENPRNIQVIGKRAYVIDDVGQRTLDVSDPRRIRLIQTRPLKSKPAFNFENDAMTTRPGLLCALQKHYEDDDYGQTIDIYRTDLPTTRPLINRISGADGYLHRYDSVRLFGHELFALGHSHSSQTDHDILTIFDLSDPAHEKVVGQYCKLQEAGGIAVSGDLIYVADGPGGLVVLKRGNGAPTNLQSHRPKK